jgi:hypothetical protein
LNKLQGNCASICLDIAQVLFASIFLPFLIDEFRPFAALLGLTLAFIFWSLSFFFLSFKP